MPKQNTICKVPDCGIIARCTGLCSKHYARFFRHGDVNTKKKGGPIIGRTRKSIGKVYKDPAGYVKIYMPSHPNANKDGCVKEHILVMSKFLNRKIETSLGENVHHLNGDRHDNRIENLELWNTSQPKGQRLEDKIKFYISFLESYGYEVKTGQKSCS